MSLMMDFYGLREHPFRMSPNPRFLCNSVQHREALNSLILGIEEQAGFAALIAEPGTGKTTLLFDILLRYRERANIAFVFNTQCSGQELLRHIAMELQIPGGESEQDPVRWHGIFTSFVAGCARTKPVVIIIDEAQNLGDSALEALRLLSNFEAADHKLMHIIIAGQPLLEENLRSHAELLQRITTIIRLARLTPMQVQEFIEHRLRIGGYSGSPLFTSNAITKIAAASGGLPREINRICMNALQLGFTLRQEKIDVEVIDSVLSELNLRVDSRTEAAQPEASPQVTQIEPEAFEMPVDTKTFEMSAEPWVFDQSVDLSLGDEVIDSVMSELNLSVDSRTDASKLGGAQSKTEPRVDPETYASGKPSVFYPHVGLDVDESIEAFLSGLELNGAPPERASKEPHTAEPRSTGVEPETPSTPVESRVAKTPVDTRVLKVFAASKRSRVPVESTVPEVSVKPIVQLEETWATNVKVEQWAQSSLCTTESTDAPPLETTKECAIQSHESEPGKIQSGLSPKAVWLCTAFTAALILFVLIMTHFCTAAVGPD